MTYTIWVSTGKKSRCTFVREKENTRKREGGRREERKGGRQKERDNRKVPLHVSPMSKSLNPQTAVSQLETGTLFS